MSWLADYLGPNPTVDDLIPQVGALLVVRRTFGGDDPYKGQPGEGEAFGGGWDGPQSTNLWFRVIRQPAQVPESRR